MCTSFVNHSVTQLEKDSDRNPSGIFDNHVNKLGGFTLIAETVKCSRYAEEQQGFVDFRGPKQSLFPQQDMYRVCFLF